MSALRSRWSEEVRLLEEEMRRTVRFYKWNKRDWEVTAEIRENEKLQGAAAYARKCVFTSFVFYVLLTIDPDKLMSMRDYSESVVRSLRNSEMLWIL